MLRLSKTTLMVKYAYFESISYFVKQRENSSYLNLTLPKNKIYLINCIYRENKTFKGMQNLVVQGKKVTKDEHERFYCVV